MSDYEALKLKPYEERKEENDDNSILAGFKVGANDYIKKPISPHELISRVRLRIGHA